MKKILLWAICLFTFLSAMECKDPVPSAVQKINIDNPSVANTIFNPGDVMQLAVTIQPPDAANKKVTWSSNDLTRAVVDATGKVSIPAKATSGKVIITVTTNDGGKKATYPITVSTTEKATYAATISPTSKTFTAATTGYGVQPAQQFTVTNTGTEPLSKLAATLLTGKNFEISTALSATSVAAGKTVTVSVRPKTGLAAGTYTDQLRLSCFNGIGIAIPLSFTVSAATAYAASIDPASKTFAAATVGYGAQTAQVFTLTNTGTGAISSLAAALTTGTAFEISTALSGTSVAANATRTVSVRPKTGLAAGTYADQLKITGSNGISLTASLGFTVEAPALTYSATVSPTSKTFTGATVGYGAQTAQLFTLTNTGTGALTGLAATLTTGTAFEISTALPGTSVAANATCTVGVRPKTGLAAGDYTDQLKITGNNGISFTVSLVFSVSRALIYTATLSPDSMTFPDATIGYGTQTPQVFTFDNTGTGALTGLAASFTTGTAFEISTALSGSAVDVGKALTVSVRPKTGLAAGTYTDQLKIAGNNGITVSATLKFKVSAQALTYTASVSPESKTFASAVEGYSTQAAQQFTLANTGTGTLTGLSATLSPNAHFEISTDLSGAAVDASKTLTVSVRPHVRLLAGTYTDQLKITGNNGINISVPLSFTVMAKTLTVGAQNGTLVWGTAGSATFPVTTNMNASGSVLWFSDAAGTAQLSSNPTGISASVGAVSGNQATVTVNTTTAAVGNTYYFKVTMDEKTSNVQSLVINYFAGEGTSAGPYLIGLPGQLAKLAELVNARNANYFSKFYKLTANISLAAYANTGWTPIGKGGNGFEGSFDGNGKSVSGLYISNSALEFTGLFGYNTGTIKNLGVAVQITNNGTVNNYAGGVAGYSGGEILNCYVSGTITGYRVGGVAGRNQGNVTNCYSAANVTGNLAGGVVAYNQSGGSSKGNITNCYVTGPVTSENAAGGVVGMNENNNTFISSIKNCVALNPGVKGANAVGRVVGGFASGSLSGNSAYSNMGTNGGVAFPAGSGLTHVNGADLTMDDAKEQRPYTDKGWPFGNSESSPWKWGGDAYPLPVLWWQSSYPTLPSHLTPLTYTASVSPASKTFASAVEGYGTQTAQQFILTNTGTGTLTGLSAALSPNAHFEISTALSGTAVDASKTLTVSVRPNIRLSAGTYTDQLKITGNNGINISVPLSFTVTVKTLTVGAQDGMLVWGTAGSATFTVTTNMNATGSVSWFNDAAGTTQLSSNPTGISASVSAVSNNQATVTVNTTTAAVGNTYYFKVTMDEKTSNVQSLVINYFAGEGTSASPYLIGFAGQLAKLAELVNAGNTNYYSKFYKLTANINLDVEPYNKGTGWTPIGNSGSAFRGTFDGDGKSVSGLFINNNTMEFVGLFSQNVGVIKNLGVTGVNINNRTTATGDYYAGGVAGYSSSDVINCYVSGTITGKRAGGVVGLNQGNITNCYSAANVSGTEMTGGVVAYNLSGGPTIGNVANCYVTGSVTSDNTAGGVVGRNENNGTATSRIQNCVALNPSVKGTNFSSNIGRIVGVFLSGSLSGNSAYSRMGTNGGLDFPSGSGLDHKNGADLTAENAQVQSTYSGKGWPFGSNETSPWKWSGGAYPLPVLWWQTSYPTLPSHLVTLSSIAVTKQPAKTTYLEGETFDPAGMVVTATYSNNTTASVTITTGMLTYDFSTAGTNKTVTIKYNDKSTTVTVNVVYFAGEGTSASPYLIGTAKQLAKLAELVNAGTSNYSTQFYKLTANINLGVDPYNKGTGWTPIGNSGSTFRGTFDGDGKSVSGLFINNSALQHAGLFGYFTTGVIKNLGVTGVNINNRTTATGDYYAGGVAGYSGGEILNCYVSGTISSKRAGGVVGWNQGNITNCYSAANVSGDEMTGGVVAYNLSGGPSKGNIANCYVTGSVTSDKIAGGVVGRNENNGTAISKIQNCVALNPSVKGTLSSSSNGRIVGSFASGSLSGNSAYTRMGTNGGSEFPSGSGLDHKNGADLTANNAILQKTYSDKGWPFGTNEANPWKWAGNPYPLPVLWWQTSYPTLPSHLQ